MRLQRFSGIVGCIRKNRTEGIEVSVQSASATPDATINTAWFHRSLNHPFQEPVTVGILAMVIGVIGGLGAIIFRYLIHVFFSLFHLPLVADTPWRAAIPAVGLVLVGGITYFFAREVKGHGVPQILESLALRGGKIRPRVAFFGILAPAITIGSGGSVGREGPIALIGGAFGSLVGQFLKLPDKYTSLLLACGSAAGIAATFNAPIAGGFFGLEVILGSYAMGAIMPVFLSAVTGATVFDAFMGNKAVLATTHYQVIHPVALIFMIVLGLVAGVLGIGYSKGLIWIEDIVQDWKAPFWVKNIAGGLLVGLIGLFVPNVLGVGYPSIHAALSGELAIGTLLLLFAFKYVATLTTIGAGGSGGVFAPSLFLGAMLGGLYGDVLRRLFPGVIPHPEIYAIAGMGAIFAAAAQAPFVAITILLEVTGDYQLTPVVIAACITAYVVHGVITRDSMYTVKLSRRGIRILRGNEVRPTERIAVSSAMAPLGARLSPDDTVAKAHQVLTTLRDHETVITDQHRRLLGVLTIDDIRQQYETGSGDRLISTVMSSTGHTIRPNQTLEDAMRLFTFYDVSLLPVVDEAQKTVCGVLTQRDVMRAYNSFTLHSTESTAKIQQLQETYGDGGEFTSVRLDSRSPFVNRALSRLNLPMQVVVVSIQRQGQVLVPHGTTMLHEGDDILLFVSPARDVETVTRQFRGSGSEHSGSPHTVNAKRQDDDP